MNLRRCFHLSFATLLLFLLASCATESSRTLAPKTVQSASIPYAGPRLPVTIGKFTNQSNYQRGVFSDGVDRMGAQARTILVTHLQQSGRFAVLDRTNLDITRMESGLSDEAQDIQGARYVLSGDVTEFGRKEVGDQQLFGIVGSGTQQIAYAKVDVFVVDVRTGEVLFATQGAGEYALSNREVLGFGGTASYDSTLNGKVLDLALREAVDGLASAVDQGIWGRERAGL